MKLEEMALQFLIEMCDRRDADIIESWRAADDVGERERCATDLKATEELKELFESLIQNEYRRNDK